MNSVQHFEESLYLSKVIYIPSQKDAKQLRAGLSGRYDVDQCEV